MGLGWKAAAVLLLMIAFGVLMIVARKRNFDGVRRHHMTRRQRVPIEQEKPPESPDKPSTDA